MVKIAYMVIFGYIYECELRKGWVVNTLLAGKPMKPLIEKFARKISAGDLEIYNEFSLQHELGCFLRNELETKKVQFERNVSYFFHSSNINFVKKEIDISIFEDKNSIILLDAAIELKYPRNGQYPEQMFSFCKDIQFAEQLKLSGFKNAFVVIFADDRLFYEGNDNGIYGYFRNSRLLTGVVQKPTGAQDQTVTIAGSYKIEWNDVMNSLKYTVIEVS